MKIKIFTDMSLTAIETQFNQWAAASVTPTMTIHSIHTTGTTLSGHIHYTLFVVYFE